MTNEAQSESLGRRRGRGFVVGGLIIAAGIAGGGSAMVSPSTGEGTGGSLPPMTLAQLETQWAATAAGRERAFDAERHAARRVSDHFRSTWPDLAAEADNVLAETSAATDEPIDALAAAGDAPVVQATDVD